MEKTTNKPLKEEVVREFPPLGKYRIRLVRNPKRPGDMPTLDIREYISSETFEGFTRRGIRLGDRAQMDLLRDVLREVLEAEGFAKPAPGLMPVQ
ncbi:MAG TPA: hypothetical protein VNM14_12595 [Planctomycetota bacterium]|nr:hypothetical protein [Planctomycetota bacterium]